MLNSNKNTVKELAAFEIDVLNSYQSTHDGTSLNTGCLMINMQFAVGTQAISVIGLQDLKSKAGFVRTHEFTNNLCDNANLTNSHSSRVKLTKIAKETNSATSAVDDHVAMTADGTVKGLINENVLSNDSSTYSTYKLTTAFVIGPSFSQGMFATNVVGTYKFTPALDFAYPLEVCYTVFDTTTIKSFSTSTLHTLIKKASILGRDKGMQLNILLSSKLSSNDIVRIGNTYGLATGDLKTLSGTILNTNASFSFLGAVVGVYINPLPVCASGHSVNCPLATFYITVLGIDMVDLSFFKQVGSVNLFEGLEGIYANTIENFCKSNTANVLEPYKRSEGLRFISSEFTRGSATLGFNGVDFTLSISSFAPSRIVDINWKSKVLGLSDDLENTIVNVASLSSSEGESNLADNTSSTMIKIHSFFIPNEVTVREYRLKDQFVIKGLGKFGKKVPDYLEYMGRSYS